MKSKSLQCTSLSSLKMSLQHTIHQEFRPTLAIVFTSLKYDLKELNELFVEQGIDLLGCTTAGEIVDSHLVEDSVVVLLMDMDRDHYSIQTKDYGVDEVYDRSFEIGSFAKFKFENPGMVILSGGIKVNADKIISGIKSGVDKEIPMYGGLAADGLAMTKTIVFSNNFISYNGLAALIIDTDKIEVQGLATSGWEALGGVKTITKSEDNILYTINGEPALDVFLKHFGFDENPETKREQLMSIQTNYPLQIIREDGQVVLRSPVVVDDKNRSIILAGGVEQGAKFRFSNSPGFGVLQQTINEFQHLKNGFAEADAVIMFSCKGRHGAFGPVLEEEVEGLYNYWKKPMIGFLSYGEIGNTKNGICEFHNETCSLMVLREK